MTEQGSSAGWHWTAETAGDGAHRFCRIRLVLPCGVIGDPYAWSVVGLVQGEIDDLLDRLAPQPALPGAAGLGASALFAGLHRWHEGGPRPAFATAGAGPRGFRALPAATEIFDGEEAWLVRSGAAALLLWRDHASGLVREAAVDFAAWLAGWRAVREAVGQDGRGSVALTVGAL
ncbi:hypothetical protein ABT095_27170 [Kitasatospora sp. NPDC002227]|uniref:hypothetical protein n=1 Tax=Kitasatospora sp. NPDC002227 TaxID=3154773 RepID=UPI00332A5B2A